MLVSHYTTELKGGAGVAAQRLHQALLRSGSSSQFFYRLGETEVAHCSRDRSLDTFAGRLRTTLAMSREHRRWAVGGFVTSPGWIGRTPVSRFGNLPEVVNLHWVSRWLDLPSFFGSLPAGLPVVWSLHDMNPLTGGCHHAGECTQFTNHCGYCPQLKHPGARDHAARWFDSKERCYAGLNLHIVGNSEWTSTQASRSALMQRAKSCHSIPLGLDTREFAPVEKTCARQALGLGASRFVVGFSCADLSDHNKGGSLLLEALRVLSQGTEITMLASGGGQLPRSEGQFDVMGLGSIQSARMQSIFYSACNVFVVPSRIESFGLTALEAMACGTPVVAFRAGGLPEVVAHQETGLLADEVGSVPALLEALRWMRQHPPERTAMGTAARRRVEKQFSDELMASRYAKLYGSLTKA
jgi:glycosyltransferase involved in cell wall biosynthesis